MSSSAPSILKDLKACVDEFRFINMILLTRVFWRLRVLNLGTVKGFVERSGLFDTVGYLHMVRLSVPCDHI